MPLLLATAAHKLSLRNVTILYLAIPYLIFFFGWLKPVFALMFAGVLILGLFLTFKDESIDAPEKKENVWLYLVNFLIILCIAYIWMSFSGLTGHGYPNFDHLKHNAVINDLVKLPWPVAYNLTNNGETNIFYLCYYIAFYLPAGLLGKIFGFTFATNFLFFWAVAGVVLTLFWFQRFTKKKSLWALAFFVLFGGLDFLGNILLGGEKFTGTSHIEIWNMLEAPYKFLEYSSNANLLYWVPQHAIGAWLVTCLLFNDGEIHKNYKSIFFLTALACLWSPFGAVGLVPFVLFLIYKSKLRELLTVQNLLSAASVGFCIFLFITSTKVDFEHAWIFQDINIYEQWHNLVLFWIIEFGLYALFIKYKDFKKLPLDKSWFYLSILILFLLPFYKLGHFNDLLMRASIPSLFIFQLFLCKYLLTNSKDIMNDVSKKLLIALLVFGSFAGLAEISRGIPGKGLSWDYLNVPVAIEDQSILNQYLAPKDAPFFKVFTKTAQPIDINIDKNTENFE